MTTARAPVVQGIVSGTKRNDPIVSAYYAVERAETAWREALECALSAPSPVTSLNLKSVASATAKLLTARLRLDMLEESDRWARKFKVLA